MRVIGVAELKATLSAQLASVKAGDEVVITERGKPIARIMPMPSLELSERVKSLARRGIVKLPHQARAPGTPRVQDPEGLLLKALLAEREESP